MTQQKTIQELSAYGGNGWRPRSTSLAEEIGSVWARCGQGSEWAPLKAVLLHRPGSELEALSDPDDVQMIGLPAPEQARRQHDDIAGAYRSAGVEVHYLDPRDKPSPNQMFVADLMFMTPEGAILARPASAVRAGEECWVARRLTDLGIPILRSVRGRGTFEGADAAWVDSRHVIIGRGLRTNADGAAQVAATLAEMGVAVTVVDLPHGTMHLMGILRFADRDLAVAWPRRLAHAAVEALRESGFQLHFIPDEAEAAAGFSLNFVTLGPREILMPAGNPVTRRFYENLGITCRTVPMSELVKAAGAVGCLTGILRREKL